MENKIFFIHETPSLEDTDDDFLNTVVHAKYEDLHDKCIEWLEKPQEERDAKALEVYNLFKTKYNLKNQIKSNSLIQALSEWTHNPSKSFQEARYSKGLLYSNQTSYIKP